MPVDPKLIAAMNAPLRAGGTARRYANKAGYFMPPGTGPFGKTCGDCTAFDEDMDSPYRCNKVRPISPKAILKRSPACGGFVAP